MREHVDTVSFNSNPNIGLFAYCNDKFCLIGKSVQTNDINKFEKLLDVPIYRVNIAGTSLLGVFCAGNSNCLLLPGIVFDDELKELDKLGVRYQVIETKLTALGNNILCNNNGAIINPEFEEDAIKKIKEHLQVEVKVSTIGELDNVGALGVSNERKCLLSIDASDSEVKVIEKLLNVECTLSTVNMGLPYLHAGIIANSRGFLISDHSTGIEITEADKGLGFLE